MLCTVLVQLLRLQHQKHIKLLEQVQRWDTKLVGGAGVPHLRKKAEKVQTVQPGEEEVVWRPHSKLPVSEKGLQRSWRGIFFGQEL